MQTWKSLKDQYRKQDERSRGSPQIWSEKGGGVKPTKLWAHTPLMTGMEPHMNSLLATMSNFCANTGEQNSSLYPARLSFVIIIIVCHPAPMLYDLFYPVLNYVHFARDYN